ncbi:glycosyltransferase family 4 protein [Candidatus Parcubacteria bacterium]|nr:glycosyltransferase family 4 protein [Candidatus Parcubacteria bacterium]
MKKIRILIATGLFPPQVGGPATYSKLLLEKLPERGFEIKIQSFGWVLGFPKIIRHVVYFFKVFFSGITADIIYAQDPVSVGLPALIAAKILRKKFYIKIVGDYAWEQGSQRAGVTDLLDQFSTEFNKYPPLVRILKRVQFFVASHADKVIVPSKYLKMIISNWGVNPQKITVIYNAFHAPHINGTKEEYRKELGWKGTIIISAGRLVPWKGFDTLISLMHEIAEKIPDAHLYIAGDGPDKNYLESKVKETKTSKYVTLLGRVKQEELFKQIKASDLFVLNTSYEGLSHQLLEVMALETPIVTTRAGGNTETVDDQKSGILLGYNDREAIKEAIISVLSDSDLREKFVSNGKKKLEFFGEERMLGEISAFLKA